MTEDDLVGVVGGGTMGAGIAQVFLGAGCRVTVIESDSARVAAVWDQLAKQIRIAIEGGHIAGEEHSVLARLRVSGAISELAGASLVIEAVPEQLELKREVLAGVEAIVGADAVIATNTSSMSIAALSLPLRGQHRFLGMHFFNPVPRSALVELVRGPETTEPVLAAAGRWAEAIGKHVIVVRDSPGFASSRLGIALGMEAIRMLEEEVAGAEDIDAAMVLGYKHPMGPLRLTDLVGLDVRLAIADYLSETLGGRFTPPQLLRAMVAEGKLGQKSGQGFYTW